MCLQVANNEENLQFQKRKAAQKALADHFRGLLNTRDMSPYEGTQAILKRFEDCCTPVLWDVVMRSMCPMAVKHAAQVG